MVIQSYNNLYLPNLSENLGVMFEHAVDIGINPTIFWNTFVNSNVAKQIEKGNPKYLTCSALDYLKGTRKSGTLTNDIFVVDIMRKGLKDGDSII